MTIIHLTPAATLTRVGDMLSLNFWAKEVSRDLNVESVLNTGIDIEYYFRADSWRTPELTSDVQYTSKPGAWSPVYRLRTFGGRGWSFPCNDGRGVYRPKHSFYPIGEPIRKGPELSVASSLATGPHLSKGKAEKEASCNRLHVGLSYVARLVHRTLMWGANQCKWLRACPLQ